MPIQFQYRRGLESEVTSTSPAVGEILVNLTNDSVLVSENTVVTESMLSAYSSATAPLNEYNTVADLKADTIASGTMVNTKGYHNIGDGGHSVYIVLTSAEYNKTPDGYADHVLANNNVAVAMYSDRINVKQFGAISDGITDSREYLAATADSGLPVVFPAGEKFRVDYALNGTIEFTSSVDFNGSTLVFTGKRNHDYSNHAFLKLNSPSSKKWTTHGSSSPLVTAIKTQATVTGKYWSGLENQSVYANHYMIIETSQPFWYYRDGASYSNPYTRVDMLIHTRDGQMTTAQKYPLDTSTITSIKTAPIDETYTVYENLNVDLTQIPWEDFKYVGADPANALLTPESNATTDVRDLSNFIQTTGSSKIRFEHITYDIPPEPRWSQWNGPVLLRIYESCLVEINEYYVPWPGQNEVINDPGRLGQSSYTYVLNYGFVNDIKIKNLVAQGDGYGAIGGFWAREVEYNNCDTNRIDAHEPVMGLKITDCTIGDHGIKLASIGDVHVKGCTFNAGDGGWVGGTRFISSRPDHRGWCDGHLLVENCTFNSSGDKTGTNNVKVYLQEPDAIYNYTTQGVPPGSPIKPWNWETQTYRNCTVGSGHIVVGNWSNADTSLIESESITIDGFRCAQGAKLTVESNDEESVSVYDRTSYWQRYYPDEVYFGRTRNFSQPIAPGSKFYNAKPNKTFTIRNSDVDYVAFLDEGEDGGLLNVTIDTCRSNDPSRPMVIKPGYKGVYNITNCIIDSVSFDTEATSPVKVNVKNNTFYNTNLQGMAIQDIQNEYWGGRGDMVTIENNNFVLKENSAGRSSDWHIREIVKGSCKNNTVLMEDKIVNDATYSMPISEIRNASWSDVQTIYTGFNHNNSILVYLTAANGDETPHDLADLKIVELKVPQVVNQSTFAKYDDTNSITMTRTNTNEITITTTAGADLIGGVRYKI